MMGKHYIITGGASGLGAATARAVLENGAKHVSAIDKQNNDALEKELHEKYGKERFTLYECDVSVGQEVDKVFDTIIEKHGYVDVVVNYAGIFDDTDYEKEIQINLIGTVRLTLKALEKMRLDKGGKGGIIINNSSTAALSLDRSHTMVPVYSATKIGILHFSNCLATEENYEKTGVKIMTVCFGPTITPMVIAYFAKTKTQGTTSEEAPKMTMKVQSPEVAIQTVLRACEEGVHGSVWIASSCKPPQDLTENIHKAYSIMSSLN